MSDPLKKVRSGQDLVIPATAYNAFIDAARDFRQRTAGLGQDAQPAVQQSGIVLVRNDSGSDRARFDVLGIDAPVIDPADNEEAFKNRVVMAGVTPVTGTHEGRFVVLAEPIAAGGIGRAFAAGVCPARVDVPDDTHDWRFAELGDGVAANLVAHTRGTATILWRAGGTGVQWAVVRLGLPIAMRLFPVVLSQTGGAQGDGSNPATWTYEVQDATTGGVLATNVNPVADPHQWQRPATGQMLVATYGYAHYQDDGAGGRELVLGWINEMLNEASVDLTNLIRYDLTTKQLQVNVGGTWTMITGGQAVSLADELGA